MLQSVGQTGLTPVNSFAYDAYGQMTLFTTPLGGQIGWGYRTFAYNSGISLNEVITRTLLTKPGAATYSYQVSHGDPTDAVAGYHADTVFIDLTNNAIRYYWTGALISGQLLILTGGYGEGLNDIEMMFFHSYYWTQDTASNIYVNQTLDYLENWAPFSFTNQTVDIYGNLREQSVWAYEASWLLRSPP